MCKDLYKSWADVGAVRMARILYFLKSKPLTEKNTFSAIFRAEACRNTASSAKIRARLRRLPLTLNFVPLEHPQVCYLHVQSAANLFTPLFNKVHVHISLSHRSESLPQMPKTQPP